MIDDLLNLNRVRQRDLSPDDLLEACEAREPWRPASLQLPPHRPAYPQRRCVP